jgi:hypothetical protein
MTDNERQEPVTSNELLGQSTTRRKVMGGSIAAGLGMFGGAMMRGGVLAAPGGTEKAIPVAAQDAEAAATPAARQVLVRPAVTSISRVRACSGTV